MKFEEWNHHIQNLNALGPTLVQNLKHRKIGTAWKNVPETLTLGLGIRVGTCLNSVSFAFTLFQVPPPKGQPTTVNLSKVQMACGRHLCSCKWDIFNSFLYVYQKVIPLNPIKIPFKKKNRTPSSPHLPTQRSFSSLTPQTWCASSADALQRPKARRGVDASGRFMGWNGIWCLVTECFGK